MREMVRAVDSSEVEAVVGALFEVRVSAGEVVIRQGEDGDNFYIVDEGECDVYVSSGGQQRLVSSLRQGNYFGELALMYNCPRAASVHARTAGTLFALHHDVFHHILRSSAQDRRAQYDTVSASNVHALQCIHTPALTGPEVWLLCGQFLQRVPILRALTAEERGKIADVLVQTSFQQGDYIIRQVPWLAQHALLRANINTRAFCMPA
jgi:cAMP-dependent protein kinase regulator